MPPKRPALVVPPVPDAAPALPEHAPYPHALWFQWLGEEISQPYFKALSDRVRAASAQSQVLPPPRERYAALRLSPLDVRVVILGQDPYHGPGQAHGLAFSVRPGTRIPPSLNNIHKELTAQGFAPPTARNGCLQPWADQGVLLLNTVLTVSAGRPGSHRGWGWERFTDAIISQVNDRCEHVVFLLWGKDAARKAVLVDQTRHLVLTSPHPSPYSAHTGFFGNGHFQQANAYLARHGRQPIAW